MSRFKFTPEMFSKIEDVYVRHDAADDAQAALDKHLDGLVTVIGFDDADGHFFGTPKDSQGRDTHTAVLFNLEPIKKPKCKHEPDYERRPGTIYCKKCTARLAIDWKEYE